MNTQNLTKGAFHLPAGIFSLGLAGFFTLASIPASADPLYHSDFSGNTGYGRLPTDWQAAANTQESATGGLVNDTLTINPSQTDSPNGGFRAFALADSVGGDWDNYTVTTTFRTSSANSGPVLIGRWDNTTYPGFRGNVGGYALALSNFGRLFTLVKDPGNTIRERSPAGILASAALSTFMPGGAERVSEDTWYTFELTMNGSKLTGRFYEGTDTSGTLLYTLTATDSTYTRGSVGLGASFGGYAWRTVQFDKITSQ